jgi:hypothetical protein
VGSYKTGGDRKSRITAAERAKFKEMKKQGKINMDDSLLTVMIQENLDRINQKLGLGKTNSKMNFLKYIPLPKEIQ